MKSPRRKRDDPTDSGFYESRAARLESVCPRCGASASRAARFCRQCGAALGAEAQNAGASQPGPRGERRHLTVMFCDLVESTSLGERLDPEDLTEIIRAYQAACAAAIDRFEGHIARYEGDGLLAYFGYPRAHENDPERAVLAALDVLAALQQLDVRVEREHGVRLAVRIGIHTGLV